MQSNTPKFYLIMAECLFRGLGLGLAASLLLALVVLLLIPNAQATGLDELDTVTHVNSVKKGSLLFKHDGKLKNAPLLQTDAEIHVSGLIARTTLTQTFINESADWVEAIYVFPLPDDAAVDQMRLQIGERIIEGEIREREQAKKIYTQAKQSGRRASLVEQERPNIFTTSVANIAPHDQIVVQISYQQNVRYDNATFSLRFPMVVAPRFIPGTTTVSGFAGSGWATNTDEVPDAARITPPVLHPDQGEINPVSIRAIIDAGFTLANISSPYHPITIQQHDTQYTVELQPKTVAANRDFQLNWQAEADNAPRAALFTESLGNHVYANVMLLPPQAAQPARLQREVIFVIDTSGSMSGSSIRQARPALLLALDRLRAGDTFNIIQFNSVTSQLFSTPQPFNAQSLQQAKHYVQRLRASGGTVMLPALQAALNQRGDEYDVRQVIFLTDGSVGNETALFDEIKTSLADTRLFTIGIGSAPNAYFMRRASRFGRGTYTYIGQVTEVQAKMDALFLKLESAVMTNLKLNIGHNVELWPQSIPDLYAGEPLLFTFRSDRLPDTITVSGKLANKDWSSELSLNGGRIHPGVSKLWAREKIAALMDQRTHGEEAEQIKQEIVTTAIHHHLVSKYTSLVAVDITPARVKEALLKTKPVPTNLPHGWDYDKVFGTLPQTATPATFNMLIGLFVFMLGMFVLQRHASLRNH